MNLRLNLKSVIALAIIFSSLSQAAPAELSDQQIAQMLIRQSLVEYPGSCPCPYSVDRAGRSCGKRSAYSKPGGYSPLCYPHDVTPEMIQSYKSAN